MSGLATPAAIVVSGRGPARRPWWHPAALLDAARRWKTFTIGLGIIAVFVICAVFAPQIAPYNPDKPDYQALLQKPSRTHLFGTDDKGRDIFSRVIYGTRVSFTISLIAVGIATAIGIPLGLLAGYRGGRIDTVVSRVLDAMFAFPVILLAIAILAITGVGLRGAIIAIGLVAIPEFARVSRSAMLAEKENDYVLASHAIGASSYADRLPQHSAEHAGAAYRADLAGVCLCHSQRDGVELSRAGRAATDRFMGGRSGSRAAVSA